MILKINNLPGLFSAQEIEEIERLHPEGVSSQQVISLFQARGVKLSEATFRKYVQLGLLPTSRRVGWKGKHRGSRGVYPVSVVRRINLIKRMMTEDLTLEQIRDSFLSIQNEMESAQKALDDLLASIAERLGRLHEEGMSLQGMSRELEQTQRDKNALMKKIEKLSSRLAIVGSPSVQEEQGGLP